MKIIKSLELLLYELMVWLVFYPRTLAMAIFRPLRLMEYADSELDDADEDRYSDTLSPPIFLAITLAIAHGVEMMGGLDTGYDGLLADDERLIAFRLVAFALFPLLLALRLLRAQGVALDRKTLRAPFYAQCFIAGPFALGIDGASILFGFEVNPWIGGGVMLAAIVWYITVQVYWFRSQLDQGPVRALGNSLRAFGEGVIACFVLAMIASVL